ncbi:hypothetical protein C8R44DRAFT_854733 [Mycena epipterygia]|nr:hypothetical protein C8R44DRAFT_854733 [Mycena epipterygia]
MTISILERLGLTYAKLEPTSSSGRKHALTCGEEILAFVTNLNTDGSTEGVEFFDVQHKGQNLARIRHTQSLPAEALLVTREPIRDQCAVILAFEGVGTPKDNQNEGPEEKSGCVAIHFIQRDRERNLVWGTIAHPFTLRWIICVNVTICVNVEETSAEIMDKTPDNELSQPGPLSERPELRFEHAGKSRRIFILSKLVLHTFAVRFHVIPGIPREPRWTSNRQ